MRTLEIAGRTLVSLSLVALPIASLIFFPLAFGWAIWAVLFIPAVWSPLETGDTSVDG